MKKYLDRLPKDMQDLIRLAGEIASLRRMRAYLIGGFVRDLMLGVQNLDLDIVIEGDGITFAEDLAGRLKARFIKHQRFGTATIIAGNNLKIDIATARSEVYLKAAALPVVEPGFVKDDLKRRDFTINAMAISINLSDYGYLLDFFNGKDDLTKKKIRVLHELSFIDDPTRILRAVRFQKRYNFQIEPRTLKLLKISVKNKMLEIVQPQRLRDELIPMLKENNPIMQLKRLYALTGFNFINQHLKLTKANEKLLKSTEAQIRWYNKVHSRRRKLDSWLMYFMALSGHLSVADIRQICKKFALRRGEQIRMLSFRKATGKFISQLHKDKLKPSVVFRMLEPLSYETTLLIKAKYDSPNVRRHIEDFLEIYNGMRIYISGHHLRSIGIEPGPVYQKIFTKVLEAKLNGLVKTEPDELALIKKLAKEMEMN